MSPFFFTRWSSPRSKSEPTTVEARLAWHNSIEMLRLWESQELWPRQVPAIPSMGVTVVYLHQWLFLLMVNVGNFIAVPWMVWDCNQWDSIILISYSLYLLIQDALREQYPIKHDLSTLGSLDVWKHKTLFLRPYDTSYGVVSWWPLPKKIW